MQRKPSRARYSHEEPTMGLSRLLLLLGLIASAAASTFTAQSYPAPPACDLSTLAPTLARHCRPSDPGVPSFVLSPTAQCCEAVVASVPAPQKVALPCLCRAAADPRLITASLDVTRLFALYHGCGKFSFGRGLNFAKWYCGVDKTGDSATATCDAAILAREVSRFCMIDKRTDECCRAVITTVRLTGRPPCLCRVAAEPQLAATGFNGTNILALYASCVGHHPVGPHLIEACKGWHLPTSVLPYQDAKTAAVLASTVAESASCAPMGLAFSMVSYAYGDPNTRSCKDLVASVDFGGGVPCLCRTAVEPISISTGLKATDLLAIYNACGGLRLGGADHKAAAASCEGYALPPPTSHLPPRRSSTRAVPSESGRTQL